jgi:hypothetical protein
MGIFIAVIIYTPRGRIDWSPDRAHEARNQRGDARRRTTPVDVAVGARARAPSSRKIAGNTRFE